MARSISTATLGGSDGAKLKASEARSHAAHRRRWSCLDRVDRWAIAFLVGLPMIINIPPAIPGRPIMNGDNLTQNYPLRVVSGELIRHGRLPLWNPYIWSGTPLLAGWNAGSLYPGTWLFAVLPGVAAWTVNLVAAYVICGVGLHVFLRRLGCSPLASVLGATTFTYTGFMTGQGNHFGLIAGMSFTPWMLLAVHELGESPGPGAARRWVALLGACAGLVVLSGEPRAVSSVGVAVGVYFLALCWRSWRARRARAWAPLATSRMLAAAVLGAGLAAVQWLPGLSFLHESNRGADTFRLFAEGSLSLHDLALLFVPFLVGGHGNLGLPSYIGSYNLPELSYGVGILPLVAAFALAWRALRPREGQRPMGVWYVLSFVAVVLSAGANTPLGRVLASIPLYGGQRLQNRNAVLVDLALAVLLAMFVDVLLSGARDRRAAREAAPDDHSGELTSYERLAGLVPVAVVIFLIVADYVWGRWIQHAMGSFSYHSTLASHLTPYFIAILVISAAAAFLLLALPRLGAASRRRLMTIIVAADVVVSLAGESYTRPAPATLALENPATAALAPLLGPHGRYAIFNPAQSLPPRYSSVIHELGPYDLNILHKLYSVQGYASVVQGRYEDSTGSHEVENLWPDALSQPTFDTLNLKELITLPQYLISEVRPNDPIPIARGTPVPPGSESVARALNAIAPLVPLPHLPPGLLSPGRCSVFMLPGPIALDNVTIVLVPYSGELPRSVSIGILDAANKIVGVRAVRVTGSEAQLELGGQVAYGLQVAAPAGSSAAIGAVAVTTAHPMKLNSAPLTRRIVLNQILQGVLEPPRWRYETEIGGLPVFADTMARGAGWIEPAGSATPLAPAVPLSRVTTRQVAAWQNPVTVVSSPVPALLVRSAAYETGWVAKIAPVAGGAAVTVPVRRLGLIQAISIPAGRFVVTWVYTSRRAKIGLLVSAVSVVALFLLLLAPRRRRRSRAEKPPRGPRDTGDEPDWHGDGRGVSVGLLPGTDGSPAGESAAPP